MWIDTPIYKEDLDNLVNDKIISWELLKDKTVLITGGTGLIGTALINSLIYASNENELNIKIIAVVRSISKAMAMFEEQFKYGMLTFVESSVEQFTELEDEVDYIIHAASPTTSGYFAEYPVETIQTAIGGTVNLLNIAKEKKALGFIYLSSMEVYGSPTEGIELFENSPCVIDTTNTRSCYPEAKRMCETICTCYAAEYGVPAKMIRLAQTFGAGISKKENRVFAQFAKAAIEGTDIILQTKGQSKQCYLYTMDAVSAILTVLLSGEVGKVYNAANKASYCSIYDMAQLVAEKVARGKIGVKVMEDGLAGKKYPPTHNILLNTDLIRELGWEPKYSLEETYVRMIEGMK